MSRVLLLNASFQPLHIISLQRAFGLLLTEKAVLIDADDRTVRTGGGAEIQVPLTLRLRYMVKVPFQRHAPLKLQTLRIRDHGVCQFVGCDAPGTSIDHVHPRSKGGLHTWENAVLACTPCNSKKDDRTLDELGWTLKTKPRAPRGSIVLINQIECSPQWTQYAAYAA